MKISLSSVSVSDQDHALKFYTQKLGFIKKKDIPLGDARWLTVTSKEDEDGPELLLEPNAAYPAMSALKESLIDDGIPFTAFEVDDVDAEYRRLRDLGVKFTQEPMLNPEHCQSAMTPGSACGVAAGSKSKSSGGQQC